MGSFDLNEREEILAKVEEMMVKGFTEASYVAKALSIAYNTAADYIEAIRTRWKCQGLDREELRKELIKNAQLIQKQLWIDRQTFKQENTKLGCLNTALKANERQAKLLGLDVDVNSSSDKLMEGLSGFIVEKYDRADYTEVGVEQAPAQTDKLEAEQLADSSNELGSTIQNDSSRETLG